MRFWAEQCQLTFVLRPDYYKHNMKFLVAFSCLLAAASAKPSGVAAPLALAAPLPYAAPFAYAAPRSFSYSVATYAAAPAVPVAYAAPAAPVAVAAPAPAPAVAYAAPAPAAVAVAAAPAVKSQYHAQDEFGQASYGHAEPYQAHNAVQDAAGNKIGSYSYVAPDGQVISANYVADALGYRVASNALPVGPAPVAETAEVSAARAAHLAEHAAAKSRSKRSLAYAVAPAPVAYAAAPAPVAYAAAPVAYAAAPVAYAAPAAPLLRAATLTTVVNTPGHAVSYRVD